MYFSDEDLLKLSDKEIDRLLNPDDVGMPKISSYFLIRWGELKRDLFLEQAEDATNFIELSKLMGFNLSNYEELEELSTHLLGLELEKRAWLLGLTNLSDAYIADFNSLSNESKKQNIESHIKSPITCYSPSHKDFAPAYEMKIQFDSEPTDNGALFKGCYDTHDYSITNRICFAIDPYASLEEIENTIKNTISEQQQQVKKSFPKIKKGNKRSPEAYKEYLILNKIIPAIDLYIVKSVYNMYGTDSYNDISHFQHGDIEQFNKVLDYYPRTHKDFENNIVKFLSEPFIFWLKAQNPKK